MPSTPITAITQPEQQSMTWLLVAVVTAMAVLPIWIPCYPAMTDVPQHAAQVEIFRAMQHGGFPFADQFVRHTRIPNLLGYGLIYLFSSFMGVVAACKLIASLALWSFVMATAWLISQKADDANNFGGGDPRLALLVVPGLYGFAFNWGLLGFLAAAPLALCFLVLANRMQQRPTLRRGVWLALMLMGLFLCHAMVAAMAAVLAGASVLGYWRQWRRELQMALPVCILLPLLGGWWWHSVAGLALTHKPVEWQLGLDRFPKLMVDIAGWPDDGISALLMGLTVVPVVALLGWRREWRAWLPLAVCVAIALLGPHSIFGVDAVYQRYALFVLPCLALVLRGPQKVAPGRAKAAVLWVTVFALICTGLLSWRMMVFDREARGFARVMDRMAPSERVLSMNFEPRSKVFAGWPLLHLPAWYSALHGGVVDPSFACGNVDLVLYRKEAMPAVRFTDFEFHPGDFDWQRHQGWRYRYFVVRSSAEKGAALFAGAPVAVRLKAHEDEWWLYEASASAMKGAKSQ